MIGTLAGQCGIVAGATNQWGRAITLELARDGVRLAIGYRSFRGADFHAAARLAREAARAGGEALPFRIPSQSVADIENSIGGLIGHWGRLDFVIDLDAEATLSRAALPRMLEQNRGRLVVVRPAWTSGVPFARSEIKQFARHGVAVNCLATGTAAAAGGESLLNRMDGRTPVGSVGRPEDLAATVYFLLTQGACITGQVIDLAGALDDAPSNFVPPIWTRASTPRSVGVESELSSRTN